MIGFIETTNEFVTKYASEFSKQKRELDQFKVSYKEYQTKIAEAVDVISREGIIPEEYSDLVLEELKSNPTKTAELIMKITDRPKTLGESSGSLHNNRFKDQIEEFCFGEL